MYQRVSAQKSPIKRGICLKDVTPHPNPAHPRNSLTRTLEWRILWQQRYCPRRDNYLLWISITLNNEFLPLTKELYVWPQQQRRIMWCKATYLITRWLKSTVSLAKYRVHKWSRSLSSPLPLSVQIITKLPVRQTRSVRYFFEGLNSLYCYLHWSQGPLSRCWHVHFKILIVNPLWDFITT